MCSVFGSIATLTGNGMPAFAAGLPSPVLRDFPLPAKVSMMPTAMTLLSIDDPSPQTAALMPSVAPISQAVARRGTEMTAARRRGGAPAQAPRQGGGPRPAAGSSPFVPRAPLRWGPPHAPPFLNPFWRLE